jgi:GNAT superfamily N-acetyltransferase
MIELPATHYANVLPLLRDARQPVVPHSVCEGYNPGRVFADDPDRPTSALVWLPCGYLFLAGEPAAELTPAALAPLLWETLVPAWQAAGETGFVLAPFSAAWAALLAALLQDQPHELIYRRTFTFDLQRFAAHRDWAARIPAGFGMQRMDQALVERLGVMPSWASTEDFLARGIGYCLLQADAVASTCTTVFATSTRVEIDVHTDAAYRGQGLATLTAAALIDECLRGGRQPHWECFWNNAASDRLAGRLGFEFQEDYPVYFWEPPAAADGRP